MLDIFDLLHLDTKEDAYTFCLSEFLTQSESFRKKSASQWGFEPNISDYKVYRGAIEIEESSRGKRSKIIPDLVLYNDKHIAVIESKMYSSEGYMQTIDYKDSKARIIEYIKSKHPDKDNNFEGMKESDVSFYYFTLAGVPASSPEFKVVRWADYYSKTLPGVVFGNEGLDAIGRAILNRSQEYQRFISDCDKIPYTAIVNNVNSWIAPYSLFSGDFLNPKWNLDSNIYTIYNGRVNGQGHSTFRTDIHKKGKQTLAGKRPEDNIWFFTRIEWEKDYVNVVINMEYWLVKDGVWYDYIPNKKLPQEMTEISTRNRQEFCKYLERIQSEDEELRIPAFKINMLHMIIKSVRTEGKTLGDVIREVSEYVSKFEEIKDCIVDNTWLDGDYLTIHCPQ